MQKYKNKKKERDERNKVCVWSRVLQHDKVCAGELGSNGLEIFQFSIQPSLLNHLSKCLATKKRAIMGGQNHR